MFASDPTLYGATFPRREFPYVNPFFAQQKPAFPWAMYGSQVPWPLYGQQQFPWSMHGQQQLPWPMHGQQQLPWSMYGQQQFPWSMYGFQPFPFTPFEYVNPIQQSYGMHYGQLPYPQGIYNLPQTKLQGACPY